MNTVARKHILNKVPLIITVVLYCTFSFSLRANVSNTFRNSLLHVNSGDYLWSLWDYLTNPYIYYLNQEDSISLNYTGNLFFTAGGSVLVGGHPIFLAFEGGRNGNISGIDPIFDIDAGDNTEAGSDAFDVKFLLGTLVYKNLGVGFLFQYKRDMEIDDPRPSGIAGADIANLRFEGEGAISRANKEDYSVTTFGIEFGQFSGGVDVRGQDPNEQVAPALPISYSIALGYRDYGVPRTATELEGQGRIFINNAPFVEIKPTGNRFNNNLNAYFGPKRREIFLNFLGWYVVNRFVSNLGISGDIIYAPALRGTNGSVSTLVQQPPANEVAEIVTTAYEMRIDFFSDLDIDLNFNQEKWGVLRFTPSIRVSYLEEDTQFDEQFDNARLFSQEFTTQLAIAFKFYFYLNKSKSLILAVGWHPRFDLSHSLNQNFTNFLQIPDLGDTEENPGDLTYTERRRPFSVSDSIVNTIRFGLSYSPFENITFHIAFAATENGLFDLSRVQLGMDYIFD